MPSVRDLAQEASVNPNTMQGHYRLRKMDCSTPIVPVADLCHEDIELIQNQNKLAQEHVQEFLQKIKDLVLRTMKVLSIITDIAEELMK